MESDRRVAAREEIPLAFECGGERLYGLLHNAEAPSGYGVLIVVGGPQTRVGSHRQFVLLARSLAANRIPVLRFDYRGIGDATGSPETFQTIDSDIRRAIDILIERQSKIGKIILWGLCDAASAAMFYAFQDPRVKGLVLVNPDTLTVTSEARTYLKHYYVRKIFDGEMWRKILHGRFDYRESILSLTRTIANLASSRLKRISGEINTPFPERMRKSLAQFKHPILLILSGRDLTADAFRDLINSSDQWLQILSPENLVTRHTLEEADHTFSTRQWRDQVAAWTLDWIGKLS
ncbi:MAG: hydrolase 1, exosortase A system-associated [Methylococcales bacterium]